METSLGGVDLYFSRRLRKKVNLFRNFLAYEFGLLNIGRYPSHLMIEPSSICNLRCVSCYVGRGEIKKRPGSMDFENFKKIIDETGEYLCSVTLYNFGEPFLNPKLLAMVKYARSRKVYVTTSTNGHFLDERGVSSAVVESGLNAINIALDGLSQETFEQYRRGGSYERVVNGIKNLVESKRRMGSKTPNILLQFIPMRQNEHEMSRLESFSRELGVDYLKIKKYNCHKDQKDWEKFGPVNEEWSRYISYKKVKGCLSFWKGMNINYDGNAVPCCYDPFEEELLGNVFKDGGVGAVWRGAKAKNFRKAILGSKDKINICHQRCFFGQNISRVIKL